MNNTTYQLTFWLMGLALVSCQNQKSGLESAEQPSSDPVATDDPADPAVKLFEEARQDFEENPGDPESLIWYGRRTAYLGRLEEAISIFTQGIQQHPADARMYRHRGHRYISTRKYDSAILDFEKAANLIVGQEDEIEPDGLPNARDIPLSTLHGNIWYHLGLAYYLQNDMDNALRAFSNRTVTERYPDNLVSGGHWLYMILRRLGRQEEAEAAIEKVAQDMDIIENDSYYKMCLFYKGLLAEEQLAPVGENSSANDVLGYGLGNWYLYEKQDTAVAKKHYRYVLDNGNQYSFAYLAAEADWDRLFVKE
ncbi:MAG: hypothetical protein AAGA85_18995 [Bacteroidota bacterium]